MNMSQSQYHQTLVCALRGVIDSPIRARIAPNSTGPRFAATVIAEAGLGRVVIDGADLVSLDLYPWRTVTGVRLDLATGHGDPSLTFSIGPHDRISMACSDVAEAKHLYALTDRYLARATRGTALPDRIG